MLIYWRHVRLLFSLILPVVLEIIFEGKCLSVYASSILLSTFEFMLRAVFVVPAIATQVYYGEWSTDQI